MSVSYNQSQKQRYRITLDIEVYDDFNPHQIDFEELFGMEGTERVVDSYVEDLSKPISWWFFGNKVFLSKQFLYISDTARLGGSQIGADTLYWIHRRGITLNPPLTLSTGQLWTPPTLKFSAICSPMLSGMLSVPPWKISRIMVTKRRQSLMRLMQKSSASFVTLSDTNLG